MNDDRRQARRYPPNPGRDSAILRHGRKAWDAQLVDVSAGGFRVSIEGTQRFPAGEPVKLETVDGVHTCEIANTSESEGLTYLGLTRLDSTPVATSGYGAQSGRTAKRGKRNRADAINHFLVYLVMPLAILIAVLLALVGPHALRQILRGIPQIFGF